MSEFDQGIGSVSYPGIQQIVSANYSRSHGITPDVCTIEMAPQGGTAIKASGELRFAFQRIGGSGAGTTTITLPDCRPDRASVRKSPSSEVWTIPIFDRRWKWKFGSFSGHWNYKRNGIIETRKKKTPRELADMCLNAMGEKRFDTSALKQLETKSSLPYRNKIFPEVHWDRMPPAQALEQLVTSLGYRVCLGWDNRVRIKKHGEGALLSTDDLMSGGFNAELPEVPDSITVLGGISMYEVLWTLEAVGLDVDGEWRPIDHLSYIPEDDSNNLTWKFTEPGVFDVIQQKLDEIEDNIKPNKTELLKRRESISLAKQTVYRCYRLKFPVGTKEASRSKYDRLGRQVVLNVSIGLRRGDRVHDRLMEKYEEAAREYFEKSKASLPRPNFKDPITNKKDIVTLQEFEQVLPIFGTRSELAIDGYTGKLIRKPAEVTGSFYFSEKLTNTLEPHRIDGDKFDVLKEMGIIRFKDPVYKYVSKKGTTPGYHLPAELEALIAVPYKSLVGEPSRYEYKAELPAKIRTGTKTKAVIKNEITHAIKAKYASRFSDVPPKVDSIVDNADTEELSKQAQAAVDVETISIFNKDSGSGVYAGLKKVELDGAIQQVAISLNTSGGMTTNVSRNTEANIYVPTFDERQRNLALKEVIKQHDQTLDNTQPF